VYSSLNFNAFKRNFENRSTRTDRALVTMGAVGARAPTGFEKLLCKNAIKSKFLAFGGQF